MRCTLPSFHPVYTTAMSSTGFCTAGRSASCQGNPSSRQSWLCRWRARPGVSPSFAQSASVRTVTRELKGRQAIVYYLQIRFTSKPSRVRLINPLIITTNLTAIDASPLLFLSTTLLSSMYSRGNGCLERVGDFAQEIRNMSPKSTKTRSHQALATPCRHISNYDCWRSSLIFSLWIILRIH